VFKTSTGWGHYKRECGPPVHPGLQTEDERWLGIHIGLSCAMAAGEKNGDGKKMRLFIY